MEYHLTPEEIQAFIESRRDRENRKRMLGAPGSLPSVREAGWRMQ